MNSRIVEENYRLIDFLSKIIRKSEEVDLVNDAKKCLIYFVNQLYEEEYKKKSNKKERKFYEDILEDHGIEKTNLKFLQNVASDEKIVIDRDYIINYKLNVLNRELENLLKTPNTKSLKTWVNNYCDFILRYKLNISEMYNCMIYNIKKFTTNYKVIEKASKYYLEKEGMFDIEIPKMQEENLDELKIKRKKKNNISLNNLDNYKINALKNVKSNIDLPLEDTSDLKKVRYTFIKEYLLKLKTMAKSKHEKIDFNHKLHSLTSVLLNIKKNIEFKVEKEETLEEGREVDSDIKKGVSLIK